MALSGRMGAPSARKAPEATKFLLHLVLQGVVHFLKHWHDKLIHLFPKQRHDQTAKFLSINNLDSTVLFFQLKDSIIGKHEAAQHRCSPTKVFRWIYF